MAEGIKVVHHRMRLEGVERQFGPEHWSCDETCEPGRWFPEPVASRLIEAPACTCGIRPDVPAGPHHADGCPMEVTDETIAMLRSMLAEAQADANVAEHELDSLRATWINPDDPQVRERLDRVVIPGQQTRDDAIDRILTALKGDQAQEASS